MLLHWARRLLTARDRKQGPEFQFEVILELTAMGHYQTLSIARLSGWFGVLTGHSELISKNDGSERLLSPIAAAQCHRCEGLVTAEAV